MQDSSSPGELHFVTIFCDQKQMSQRLEHIIIQWYTPKRDRPSMTFFTDPSFKEVGSTVVSPSPRGWNDYAQIHRTAPKRTSS